MYMGTISATVDDGIVKRIDEMVAEQNRADPGLRLSRAKMIGQLIAAGFELTVDSAAYADVRELAAVTAERDGLRDERDALLRRTRELEERAGVMDDRYARADIQFREEAARRVTAEARIEEMTALLGEREARIADLRADKDLLKGTLIPLLEGARAETYEPPQPTTLRARIGAIFG
jgi:chromosome segregation ATPase